MGVLGGFKNMLRTWRNNLRKKKKKKTNFIYTLVAIIIYPFMIFFKKDELQEIKKIEKKIDLSKTKSNKIKKNINITKQKEINNKIILKEKIIEHNKSSNEEKIIEHSKSSNEEKKSIILPLENKITDIKCETKVVDETLDERITASKEKNTKLLPKKEKKNFIDIVNIKNIFKSNKKTEDNNVKKQVITPIIPIVLIKEKENKIDTIFSNKTNTLLNDKINDIKEKIKLLKEEYERNNLVFEEDFKFDDIKILEEKINDLNIKLQNKKKELLICKKEDLKKEKEELKEKKEVKELKNKKVTEFELCNQIVIENIKKCDKYYNDFLSDAKNNKKNVIFKHMKIMSNSILNFMLGIFPFRFIKNRFLVNYIIALNVNNSIRTMNRMINPLDINNYYIMLDEYKDLKNVLENTYIIMNDSLERILKIKEYLISIGVYNVDIDLYNKIVNAEKLINENIKQMNEKNNNLNKMYVKIKKNIK
jgi:hypothetical protein